MMIFHRLCTQIKKKYLGVFTGQAYIRPMLQWNVYCTIFILETRHWKTITTLIKWCSVKRRICAEVFKPARSWEFWQWEGVNLAMDLSVQYRICVDDVVAYRHRATQPIVFDNNDGDRVSHGGGNIWNPTAGQEKARQETAAQQWAKWFRFTAEHCIEAGCHKKWKEKKNCRQQW